MRYGIFICGVAQRCFIRRGSGSAFRTKFEDDKLSQMLRDVIGEDTTLGSEKLRTLLMIVLRNATTDSPWSLSNNPAAKYNDWDSRGEASNLKLPLWRLVRASTAA